MLVIRRAQLEALQAAAQSQRRGRLFFRLSTRALPFPVELLGPQFEIGLQEAARLDITRESDVAYFLEIVLTRMSEFSLNAEGHGIYPPGSDRFLLAPSIPALERLRRFEELVALSSVRHAG